MEYGKREMRKRKLLEVAGCLLYIIAFLIMGVVFLVRCGNGG
jgi:hypothetical protein